MTDFFTTDPTKGTPGSPLKVCFDFGGANISGPIECKLDWGPASVPDETFELTAAQPCKTVTVPAAATSCIISDSSEDHAVFIS
jgi:hypothetical protein